jgi:xanthine/uracil permease
LKVRLLKETINRVVVVVVVVATVIAVIVIRLIRNQVMRAMQTQEAKLLHFKRMLRLLMSLCMLLSMLLQKSLLRPQMRQMTLSHQSLGLRWVTYQHRWLHLSLK